MKIIEFDNVFDETVLAFLNGNLGKLFRKDWKFGDSVISIFIREEYIVETRSYQNLTVIFEAPNRNQKSSVTIIGSGGRKDSLDISGMSGSPTENILARRIEHIVSQSI